MSIVEAIFEYPFLMKMFNEILFWDIQKLNLICNKFILERRNKLRFNEQWVCLKEDQNKWYYNCLTNIRVYRDNFKFPESIIFVYYDSGSSPENLIQNNIPQLEFCWRFDSPICSKSKDSIFIKSLIPNSIVHLKFGILFNKSIENCIPNSVKYLTLQRNFSGIIKNLPESIISLILKTKHCRIENLPQSLKYLEVHEKFRKLITKLVYKNVKIKYFK